jgi:hypothetical protein
VGPIYDLGSAPNSKTVKGCVSHLEEEPTEGNGSKKDCLKTVVTIPLSEANEDDGLSVENFRILFAALETNLAECLLFLRSVVSITLRIDPEGYVVKAEVPMGSREHRATVASALADIEIWESERTLDLCYATDIVQTDRRNWVRTFRWRVFHHMRGFSTREQASWAAGQGLVKWTAIAAMDGAQPTSFEGRLFDPLPSNFTTEQPVHIFGLFAPADGGESEEHDGTWECSPHGWNAMVLEILVPHSWTTFLLDIVSRYTAQDGQLEDYFRHWPRHVVGDKQPAFVDSVYHNTLRHIILRDFPLWPTVGGFLPMRDVYFSRALGHDVGRTVESRHLQGMARLQAGLEQLGMPVAYIPDDLFCAVEDIWPERRTLTPVAVAVFLTENLLELKNRSEEIKVAFLDFLLSRSLDGNFGHLMGIPLIPTCDGGWKALEYLSALKLPTDSKEMLLFNKKPQETVDIRRLSARAHAKLTVLQVSRIPGLEPWHLGDVRDYCTSLYCGGIEEESSLASGEMFEARYSIFVRSLWEWIAQKQEDSSSLTRYLGGLWLIPLLDGNFQRLCAASPLLPLDVRDTAFGEFVLLNVRRFIKYPILDQNFPPDAATLLKSHSFLWDSNNIGHVLKWLSYAALEVSSLSPSMKEQLSQHLADLARIVLDRQSLVDLRDRLRKLEIFEELCNTADGTVWNWTCLPAGPQYVGVDLEDVIPEMPHLVFIQAKNSAIRDLLGLFGLAELPDTPKLLSTYVIPALSSGLPTYILERLGLYVLGNFASLAKPDIQRLRNIAFIPARTMDGGIKRLIRPSRSMDPRNETFRSLYFDHECIWVDDFVVEHYEDALAALGMLQSITIELVLERVAFYISSANTVEFEDISARAEALIRATSDTESIKSMRFREGVWLPVSLPDGEMCLSSPSNCRDTTFMSIVCYSMGIVGFPVGPCWSEAFGWLEPIPADHIRRHIERVVESSDEERLEDFLDYIGDKEYYDYALREFAWIPSESWCCFCPADIFFNDFTQLEPLCGTVRGSLLKYASLFRRLGVCDQPSFEKLAQVNEHLGQTGVPLQQKDLDMSVTVCVIAARLYPEMGYSHFQVPDWRCVLGDAGGLVADEPYLCEVPLRFVHPAVPKDVREVFGIPFLKDTNDPIPEKPASMEEMQAQAESTTGMDGVAAESMDLIRDALSRYSFGDAFSMLLSYIESLEGTSFVEWKLNYDHETVADLDGGLDEGPELFLITDGGKF